MGERCRRSLFEDKVAVVWRVADKLRGTFEQHEYGSVMLPLVLRRLDAVLVDTKIAVLEVAGKTGDRAVTAGTVRMLARGGSWWLLTVPAAVAWAAVVGSSLRRRMARVRRQGGAEGGHARDQARRVRTALR